MTTQSRDAEHDDLSGMWTAGKFEPAIRHIRFPYFRNLSENLKIEFTHPITALVGPNGTNKSSILRALQGCPEDQNIGRFWFGTPMDTIPVNERHRFIHGRWSESAQEVVEAIQIRRPRKRPRSASYSPDYFESDGPLKRDNMKSMPPAPNPLPSDRTETRWRAVQKDVAYFDFRAEISAFDKYFYHNDASIQGRSVVKYEDQLRQRKDFLLDKSAKVKTILAGHLSSFKPGGKQVVVEAPRSLSGQELKAVEFILERSFTKIEVLTHRTFRATGTTAKIETSNFSYSEAWAGSGEFAVIKLVMLLMNCDEYSLVLLDEPEVSLHPGAQARLMQFIVERTKAKKLQIVMATHSPTIVNTLPAEAIKVLERSQFDGKVLLRDQRSTASEAFVALQHHTKMRTVFVEDRLAKEILEYVLRRGGVARLNSIDVKIQPGGCTVLRTKSLPLWALEDRSDVLILLDGDQKFTLPKASSSIASADLDEAVKVILGGAQPRKYVPADTGGPTDASLSLVIDWTRRFVRFLPGSSPDHWLATVIAPRIRVTGDGKEWWDNRVRTEMSKLPTEYVTSDERFYLQKASLRLIPANDPAILQIEDVIGEFLGR